MSYRIVLVLKVLEQAVLQIESYTYNNVLLLFQEQ